MFSLLRCPIETSPGIWDGSLESRHRTVLGARKRAEEINRKARKQNGPGTWIDLKVVDPQNRSPSPEEIFDADAKLSGFGGGRRWASK